MAKDTHRANLQGTEVRADGDNGIGHNSYGRTVNLWHERMARQYPSLHVQWVMGIRNFVESLENRPLHIGTMFSSSDMCQVVFARLARYWKETYNIRVTLHHAYMCERSAEKQSFLKAQFSPIRVVPRRRRDGHHVRAERDLGH